MRKESRASRQKVFILQYSRFMLLMSGVWEGQARALLYGDKGKLAARNLRERPNACTKTLDDF